MGDQKGGLGITSWPCSAGRLGLYASSTANKLILLVDDYKVMLPILVPSWLNNDTIRKNCGGAAGPRLNICLKSHPCSGKLCFHFQCQGVSRVGISNASHGRAVDLPLPLYEFSSSTSSAKVWSLSLADSLCCVLWLAPVSRDIGGKDCELLASCCQARS